MLTYDPNGNLTAQGTKTYEWNARNELVRVLDGGSELARFAYDGFGRRAAKTTGGVTRQYVYDGEDILEERGDATSRHVHGLEIDQPLATVTGSEAAYYLADHLGSIVQRTDAAAAVTLTRQYDPYGRLHAGEQSSGYAFTGREWDAEINSIISALPSRYSRTDSSGEQCDDKRRGARSHSSHCTRTICTVRGTSGKKHVETGESG